MMGKKATKTDEIKTVKDLEKFIKTGDLPSYSDVYGISYATFSNMITTSESMHEAIRKAKTIHGFSEFQLGVLVGEIIASVIGDGYLNKKPLVTKAGGNNAIKKI